MRSILLRKQLRWYYCSSALDRRRVWDVPVPFRARNTSIRATNEHSEPMQPIRRSTSQHSTTSVQPIRTQRNIAQLCAANQEREDQRMAPRSPTFRRVSLKGRPRLYREFSASKLFDLISLFNAATWLLARDSQSEYTPRTCQLYEFHTVR
jgi:hypothetical protein